MSRKVLPSVDIQLKNLVAILTFFVSADLLHSSLVLSRHAIFCCNISLLLYSVLCVATEEILSRQISLTIFLDVCRDIENSVVTLFICVQLIYASRP